MTAHSQIASAHIDLGRPATLEDVAKLVGVSPMTVSRAINGGPVAEETRRKVDGAVRRLRYKPNRAAQLLSGRRARG